MVKAGEASVTLYTIMGRLAEMQEYEMEIKAKVNSATRYPLLALGTLVIAFFVIVTFVIPRFAMFFSQFKMELPLPTRILLGIYNFIHNYWYMVILGVLVLVVAFVKFINTPFGRQRWDNFKLRAPIFGPIIFKLSMSRFAKTLATLFASGISMLESLELTANTVGNVIIAKAVLNIRESVNEGKGLAEPMKVSRLFTPIIIQMVSIGEESGKLDELLLNASEHYDQQVDYAMKNLTTMIEPVLILCLGIMVLFVALGIFLPMWNMIQIVRQ
jgi:type II secretory pathway component PulF